MGGGGFAQYAKNVTESNRALLRSKSRSRKTKDDVYGIASVTKLSFKKSTPRDIDRIRKKMFIQRERQKRVNVLAFFLTIIILFMGYLLFR